MEQIAFSQPDYAGVVTSIFGAAIQAAIPDEECSPSEWADKYRRVSQGPLRGQKWRMGLVPYFIEPLNCVDDPAVKEIVFMGPSRIAKTEALLLNATGFLMHKRPTPIMHLRPNDKEAKRFSRERVRAFLTENRFLGDLVDSPRSRDGGNTQLFKRYLGGSLYIAGAESSTDLRADDIAALFADEIDDMPQNTGKQGDPVELAKVRLRNFAKYGRALSVLTSSPTIKGESRIESAYEASDQRHFYVPCLGCGEYLELLWEHIVWTKLNRQPEDAAFLCPNCGHVGEETDKEEMIERGYWEAHAPFKGIAGFKFLGTCSPWVKWGEMAFKFWEAKRKKSYELWQVWINTMLGDVYEVGTGIEEDEFQLPREKYDQNLVPAGVIFITFGVDVHPDRFEIEVLGWGLEDETWSIDYKVIFGDPTTYPSQVWTELEDYLTTEWQHELGVPMTASYGAFDTGGHATDQTYKFLHEHRRERWYAVKGSSMAGRPIAPRKPSKVGNPTIKLFIIGTEAAKDKAAGMFRVTKPGPHYCHLPERYDEEWHKQICSERRTRTTNKRGQRVWVWVCPPGKRNEAWDCRVYNIAAKEIAKPNPASMKQRLLAQVEAAKNGKPKTESKTKPNDNSPPQSGTRRRTPPRPGNRPRSGGFARNW